MCRLVFLVGGNLGCRLENDLFEAHRLARRLQRNGVLTCRKVEQERVGVIPGRILDHVVHPVYRREVVRAQIVAREVLLETAVRILRRPLLGDGDGARLGERNLAVDIQNALDIGRLLRTVPTLCIAGIADQPDAVKPRLTDGELPGYFTAVGCIERTFSVGIDIEKDFRLRISRRICIIRSRVDSHRRGSHLLVGMPLEILLVVRCVQNLVPLLHGAPRGRLCRAGAFCRKGSRREAGADHEQSKNKAHRS